MTNLTEALSPASHQLWLQAEKGIYPSHTHDKTIENKGENEGK
jgi:hypothetical protein